MKWGVSLCTLHAIKIHAVHDAIFCHARNERVRTMICKALISRDVSIVNESLLNMSEEIPIVRVH